MLSSFKKIKNNKGNSNIPRVISIMIMLVAFTFVLDMIVLLVQFVSVGYITQYASRQLSTQGGLAGASTTVSTDSLVSPKTNSQIIQLFFLNKFAKIGIKDEDWAVIQHEPDSKEVTIYNFGVKTNLGYVSSPRQNMRYNISLSHGAVMGLEVKLRYNWKFCPLLTTWASPMTFTIYKSYSSEYMR